METGSEGPNPRRAHKRAAIYCRTAAQAQAEPDAAVDEQIATCATYCTVRGYTVVDRFIDAGHSGNTDRRPGLIRLLQDAEAGRFDIVVLVSLDRLARGADVRHALLARLERAGTVLVAVTGAERNEAAEPTHRREQSHNIGRHP